MSTIADSFEALIDSYEARLNGYIKLPYAAGHIVLDHSNALRRAKNAVQSLNKAIAYTNDHLPSLSLEPLAKALAEVKDLDIDGLDTLIKYRSRYVLPNSSDGSRSLEHIVEAVKQIQERLQENFEGNQSFKDFDKIPVEFWRERGVQYLVEWLNQLAPLEKYVVVYPERTQIDLEKEDSPRIALEVLQNSGRDIDISSDQDTTPSKITAAGGTSQEDSPKKDSLEPKLLS